PDAAVAAHADLRDGPRAHGIQLRFLQAHAVPAERRELDGAAVARDRLAAAIVADDHGVLRPGAPDRVPEAVAGAVAVGQGEIVDRVERVAVVADVAGGA